MFDTSYKFRSIHHNKIKIGQFDVIQHKLTFCCKKNQQYIVHVDEFRHNLYIISFYLKSQRFSEKTRYKIKSNLNIPAGIIRSCINILIEFYKKYPFASFGFVGERSKDEDADCITKRFKVYSKVVKNFISPIDFNHYAFPDKNVYLLLNKDNMESDILKKIEAIFDELIESPTES